MEGFSCQMTFPRHVVSVMASACFFSLKFLSWVVLESSLAAGQTIRSPFGYIILFGGDQSTPAGFKKTRPFQPTKNKVPFQRKQGGVAESSRYTWMHQLITWTVLRVSSWGDESRPKWCFFAHFLEGDFFIYLFSMAT